MPERGLPSRLRPRPSGITFVFLRALFGFLFPTMPRTRAFSCTVTIDVRELADLGKFRKMLSQLLLIRFILLSRLLPFSFWVMMQKSPLRERRTSGRSWIGNMSILMALTVLFEEGGGGDPTPQNVLVYVYGDVKYVRFLNCTHIADICDGERTVRMVRTWAIPRNLVIDGFPVKISYPGQAPECDICGELGHIARNCALRGKCLECRQPGHLQRNCPVRLRRLQRSADLVDGRMLPPPARTPQALLRMRLSPTMIRLLLCFQVFHLLIRG